MTATRQGRRYLTWIAFAATCALVPAMLLVLLEAGLRVAGYGYPTAFWLAVPGRQAVAPNYRYGWRFFPPEIARTPEPHLLARPKPERRVRIFVLGESAAMGFPDPAFSFGRMLGAMLGEMYPGARFEVVNAAMTAINSHAILPIARDCAAQQPDLFVLYIGNNEVVGPYGPGTVFHGYSPVLPLIRAGIWVRATRTGELLGHALGRIGPGGGAPLQWRGMAMFLHNQVAAADPRMPAVYANFRRNLRDICKAGRDAGAGVVLATVATNLRDSPPFASLHRQGLSPADQARWDERYHAGAALEAAGDPAQALEAFRQAGAIDDAHAELQFHMARCELRLGDPDAARRFTRARDLDALRFRADSRLNAVVRELAAELHAKGVRLADAEGALAEDAPDRIPGREFFYEHVHLNFSGNYRVAAAVLRQVIPLLPDWVRRGRAAEPPSEARVAALLAFTDWDRYRSAGNIAAMLQEAPFTNQLDAAAAEARQAAEAASLEQRLHAPGGMAAARAAYAQALAKAPEDLPLRQHYAALLAEMRDPEAAGQWRLLLAQLPDVALWHQGLAFALAAGGRLDASIEEYKRALALDPGAAGAHLGLGAVLEKQAKLEAAAGEYEAALRLDAGGAEAHNNLGLVLRQMGRAGEAIEHFQAALRLAPESAATHNNLGLVYAAEGRLAEAVREYTEAVRLGPEVAAARYNLAAALARAGRFPESEAQLREAARLEPGSAQAHAALGGALAAQAKWREAAAQYAESLRLQPASEEAHYDLGLVLSSMGRLPEAISQYQAALRLNPDSARAHNNLGSALARLGRFQEALEHLRLAVRLQPGMVEAHYNFGMALGAVGKWTESAREFREALRLRPDFAAAREALARAPEAGR